jgi:endoglucanase
MSVKTILTTAIWLALAAAGNAHSAVDCEIAYVNAWNAGYQLDVKVTNRGDSPIGAWSVTLHFAEPSRMTNSWNAILSGGTVVTASNDGNNGNLAPSQYATFGVQGSHDGSFVTPTCTGDEGASSSGGADGFVSRHGRLHVNGGRLVDQSGVPVQLRGMSSFGLQWAEGGPYMNIDSIRWLRDDWHVNAVRAAMYTAEGGYISDPGVADKVWEIVDAAIALDIYVIVDWHILSDNDPNLHKSQAKTFFVEVATRYGDTPNVLYEIANEPNGVSWSGAVKPYANEVIPVIRGIDPDGVIIVGTPTWSQDVDVAAADPLIFPNVMYAVHFYACTHGQYLRDKVDAALAQGAAIFSTEWGTSAADGNGGNCLPESNAWLDFFDRRGISWLNWSLGAKNETSAALKPGAGATGGWSDADLSTSGTYIRNRLRSYGDTAGGKPSSSL